MANPQDTRYIEVVDSHTEGEPTRVVISGFPALKSDTMVGRREEFKQNFDHLRRGIAKEPRGHDAIVGAILTEPVNSESHAGVIFFNDVGYLGMCGHGLIGVARTLKHLNRFEGDHLQLDTPVGTVHAWIDGDGIVIRNVPSWLYRRDVEIDVLNLDVIKGDIAYGGNWFFLTAIPERELHMGNLDFLMEMTKQIRRTLRAKGITGDEGAEIDHIELYSPSSTVGMNARNFVLCPGSAYDRSPCGTGTSAKMAALYERHELKEGAKWNQESITGSFFTGWLVKEQGQLIPHVRGRAFVTGEGRLRFDPADPFVYGF